MSLHEQSHRGDTPQRGAKDKTRRSRRRVFRPADVDYDRSADVPHKSAPAGSDAERSVPVDDEQVQEDSEEQAEAFYREQMPPHYGS